MRPDSALSHLYDDELCVAAMKDATERQVRWSRPDWCFFYTDANPPKVCSFDDIKEWRPASIKFKL
jgi:hypothetical protein